MGRGAEGEWEEEEPVQDPGPPCRREVQPGSTSFLSTMDVLEGWSRLRKTRGAGRGERLEVEGLGVAGGRVRCSYPRPLSWHPRRRIRWRDTISFFSLYFGRIPFLCDFIGAHHIFLGQAWAEGRGELATCRAADGKPGQKVHRHSLERLYASMNKHKKWVYM